MDFRPIYEGDYDETAPLQPCADPHDEVITKRLVVAHNRAVRHRNTVERRMAKTLKGKPVT